MTRTAGVLAYPGAAAARAMSRTRGLTVIGWHRVDRGTTGLSTTFDDFRAQLDVLQERQVQVLPLDEAARLLAIDELPERACALTFDDGYASVIELAWPELRARGLPATLFAVTGYLDGRRRFPWDEHHVPGDPAVRLSSAADIVAAAADGLDVGSHTVNHHWLPRLDPGELADEVRRSRCMLEDLLQRPVTSFAYPMGGWTPAVRDQVEAAGYRIAVTVDRGRNRPEQHPLSLRRSFAFDRGSDFRMQLQGAYTWMRPLERWRTRGGPRW
jgi:peptidoglycan/xylan/chitin deacetylase (PgdA/CDA1 family)